MKVVTIRSCVMKIINDAVDVPEDEIQATVSKNKDNNLAYFYLVYVTNFL